jgi:serine/threonine protein kinase
MPPEMVSEQPYGPPADVWALGCILYDVCALKPAFSSLDAPGLVAKITSGRAPLLPRRYLRELRALGRSMLFTSAERRPTAAEVLAAPVLEVRVNVLANKL